MGTKTITSRLMVCTLLPTAWVDIVPAKLPAKLLCVFFKRSIPIPKFVSHRQVYWPTLFQPPIPRSLWKQCTILPRRAWVPHSLDSLSQMAPTIKSLLPTWATVAPISGVTANCAKSPKIIHMFKHWSIAEPLLGPKLACTFSAISCCGPWVLSRGLTLILSP